MEHYSPPSDKLPFRSDKRYHVFLSFRGQDVRKTLVDHLYEALSAAGLNVFLDSEKLEKGESIEPSLETAIQSSAILIPIFSKGYAESVWCLKEAAAMVKTQGLIIPLFYYVDPTHVRYPLNDSSTPSPYKESFDRYYSRSDRHPKEKVDEWKDTLLQICKFSGWSMDITQGFEARLVKKVVNDLIKTLDRVLLEVAKYPVGIDSIKNAFIQELHLDSVNEVIKVGIWGIGGIGKTTIAKALYNQLYADFEAVSFVSNVRTTAAEPKGLRNLQRKILRDLCKYGEKVDSVDEGKSLLRNRLGGIRVLLILDDVDDVEQLRALVGDWLAPRSRVIITTRDKHVLSIAQVQCIHEIGGLEINKGLQLFSWHAFLRASPNPSYEDLSKEIVEACKGHPLSLEVIGSFLYDKKDHRGCWTEALSNIILHPEIQKRVYNTLKISYNALGDEEKEIFVDIACFFIGEDKTYPLMFWKSIYNMVETAIFNLSMKLLIKMDDKGKFYMHDHLRDMGRRIAKTEKEGTRLWEAAQLSTQYNTNLSRLRFNGRRSRQRLETLYSHGLRYLHLLNPYTEDMPEDRFVIFPPSLIWLRWEDYTGRLELPRHPRFGGNICELKIMEAKGYIDLRSPCISSLFSFPNIPLEYLDLSNCEGIYQVPDTIGNLSQLRHLDLQECRYLTELPYTIGNLSQLQDLNLKGCVHLNKLPDTIGKLSQLRHLDLESCRHLNELFDNIGKLSQLRQLNLQGCWKLNNLPDTICNLSQLQHLNLRGCWNLNNLPDAIGKLSELRHLNLEWCSRLDKLPHTIGQLSKLEHLNLQNCVDLNELPDTIGNLSQLKHLDLNWCNRLNNLPDAINHLSQLQYLDLRWSGIDRPHTVGHLSDKQSSGVYRLEI